MNLNSNFLSGSISNLLSTVNSYFYPIYSLLGKIKDHAANSRYGSLLENLNQLCGSNGQAKIEMYKENYQIHLFFNSKQKCQEISTCLIEQFKSLQLQSANLSFDHWQKEDTESSFCLKLSTNQSTALLGLNPNSETDFFNSQNILKETKALAFRLSQTLLKDLPNDAILKILQSLNTLEVLGRFAQLNQRFLTLINTSEALWRSVAEIREITLPITMGSGLIIKNQVKKVLFDRSNALIGLKESNISFDFTGRYGFTVQSIEENPEAKCLVNTNKTKLKSGTAPFFYGTALGYDTELKEHVLVFVGVENLTEDEFAQLMNDTIKKLSELKIIPKSFRVSTCRATTENYIEFEIGNIKIVSENFQKWQKKQKKM